MEESIAQGSSKHRLKRALVIPSRADGEGPHNR
jgi:hypothetical protein